MSRKDGDIDGRMSAFEDRYKASPDDVRKRIKSIYDYARKVSNKEMPRAEAIKMIAGLAKMDIDEIQKKPS